MVESKPNVSHPGMPISETLDKQVQAQHEGDALLADALNRLAASEGTDLDAKATVHEVYLETAGADAGEIPQDQPTFSSS